MTVVDQKYQCPNCKQKCTCTIANTGTGFIPCGQCNTILRPWPNGIDAFGRKPTKLPSVEVEGLCKIRDDKMPPDCRSTFAKIIKERDESQAILAHISRNLQKNETLNYEQMAFKLGVIQDLINSVESNPADEQ